MLIVLREFFRPKITRLKLPYGSSLALSLFMLLQCTSADALTREQARAKGLAWLMESQTGDGGWVDFSGNQAMVTATVDEALALSGISQGYVVGAGTSWLFNAKLLSNDSLARTITALARNGQDTSIEVQQLMAASAIPAGTIPTWGTYPGYQATPLDTALAYEALTAAKNTNSGYAINAMSRIQRIDGGWSYSDQAAAKSSLIPTAYALRAIANYVIYNPASKASIDATTMMTDGVNWLLARKKNDGGFAEDADVSGSNILTKPSQVMETALVWSTLWTMQQAGFTVASTTNATQAMTSAETFLINNQQADGSWNKDALETASVVRAWAVNTLVDTKNTGVPDVVQAALSGQFNVTDPRSLPKGNGNPVPAVVAANNSSNANSSGDVPTLPEWGAIFMASLLIYLNARSTRTSNKYQE